MIAWRRVTLANLRRKLRGPGARRAGDAASCSLVRRRCASRGRSRCSCSALGAFVIADAWRRSSGAGCSARRAMTGEPARGRARPADPPQPPALRRLHRPRRDGGAVHRGGGVVGVPALSATSRLRPGRRRRSTATRSRYVRRPGDRQRAGEPSDHVRRRAGRVARTASTSTTLTTKRGFYPVAGPDARASSAASSTASRRARSACDAGIAARHLGGDAARHRARCSR